jgi:hypothetical protein
MGILIHSPLQAGDGALILVVLGVGHAWEGEGGREGGREGG